MPQGLERTLCVGVELRQRHMHRAGHERQGRRVLDCAGLEDQRKDSDQRNKVPWSYVRVRLREQVCPLGRVIRQP